MNREFKASMLDRGWHYRDLEQLCDEHMRLFIESYRILQLCDHLRTLTSRTLEALAGERERAAGTSRHLPWDLTRGYPLPEDLC